MSDNKERYSILAPLSEDESYNFAIELINFFNPINTSLYRKGKKIEPYEVTIYPLSLGDFMNYLKEEKGMEGMKYTASILKLIHKLEKEEMISRVTSSDRGSPPFSNTYYSLLETTELQKKYPSFFMGKVLGMSYLRKIYERYIVRIEGEYCDSKSATGSGILINNNTILTCGHNISDIKNVRCFSREDELKIVNMNRDQKHDIGIIKIEKINNITIFPYFGMPRVLDRTLTLGYPPFRGMREAPLIAQTGEINAIAHDWQGAENITISSITRPGNSGGPVISKEGYIVGIVVSAADEVESISSEKDVEKSKSTIPFYNAISSNEIINILKDMDDELKIVFEDYK